MLLPDWNTDIVPHLEFRVGGHRAADPRPPCAMEWLCEMLDQKSTTCGGRQTCPPGVSWACARMVMAINDTYRGGGDLGRGKLLGPYLPMLVDSFDAAVEIDRINVLNEAIGLPLRPGEAFTKSGIETLTKMLLMGNHSTSPSVELILAAQNWIEQQRNNMQLTAIAQRANALADKMCALAGATSPAEIYAAAIYANHATANAFTNLNPSPDTAAPVPGSVPSVLEPV